MYSTKSSTCKLKINFVNVNDAEQLTVLVYIFRKPTLEHKKRRISQFLDIYHKFIYSLICYDIKIYIFLNQYINKLQ